MKPELRLLLLSFQQDYWHRIHGPGKPATKKPFIILYAEENEQELYRILKEKLNAYPEEFPDTEDAYVVQILFDGAYYDKRIRWTTI